MPSMKDIKTPVSKNYTFPLLAKLSANVRNKCTCNNHYILEYEVNT